MSSHASPPSHILGEQQGLLHGIGDIASCPFLEIANGGIGEKRFPIQYKGRVPSWRPHLGVTSLFDLPLPGWSIWILFEPRLLEGEGFA